MGGEPGHRTRGIACQSLLQSLPVPGPSTAPTESVDRPDPGLARGRWEAPPWAFYVVLAAAIVGGLTWLALALRTRRLPR
jgi:hypothetical protein